MKKLTYIIVLLIATSLFLSQAQAQKIHNPDAKVTVAADKIKAWGAPSQQVSSNLVSLTFEGLGNLDEISQFYNGGTSSSGLAGSNYGIYFSKNALAIINMEKDGGSGNFTNEEGSHTAMFFLTGTSVTMNVPKGFTDALSFHYVSLGSGTVSVYDEPDGTGNLLASLMFPASTQIAKGKSASGIFSNWNHLGVTFSGKAKSVTFSGTANQCAFDNIILGGEKTSGVGEPAKTKPIETGNAPQATFVASGKTVKTPTTKGKYFVAGSTGLEFNLGVEKQISGSGDYKTTYYDFDFLPRAGYFFINNLAAGLYMDLDIYGQKAKDEGMLNDKGTTFIIGPFARYYIPVCDKFIPFAEAQVGFGIDYYKSRYSSSASWMKSDQSVFTYRLGGGATYFFNDIVGADLFLGFNHDSYKYKNTSGDRSSDSKTKYNEFILQLGIVLILDL
jgi:hypothetical protein